MKLVYTNPIVSVVLACLCFSVLFPFNLIIYEWLLEDGWKERLVLSWGEIYYIVVWFSFFGAIPYTILSVVLHLLPTTILPSRRYTLCIIFILILLMWIAVDTAEHSRISTWDDIGAIALATLAFTVGCLPIVSTRRSWRAKH